MRNKTLPQLLYAPSHYSASKGAAAGILHYMGKERGLACINLRLYSVYGPYEDSSRLIPQIVLQGMQGELPSFVDSNISRDFVYIDDVCEAFIVAALTLKPSHYGESLNIGSGECTTIGEISILAKQLFAIEQEPEFIMPKRAWDVQQWVAHTDTAKKQLQWQAKISLKQGLLATKDWVEQSIYQEDYAKKTKLHPLDSQYSVSAVVACYKDGEAIPIMYQRLTKVFQKLDIDYEIIFINDASPDDSEAVIQKLSQQDRHVIGVTHSRNFGSQSAFRSGMQLSTKNACVLLDGDLQDPPELIEDFVAQWKAGFEVVYGRRIKREASVSMQFFYKLFYRVFDAFSYIVIPRDAGDFSLIDQRVVKVLLQFPERDLFLRGVRAYTGFLQTGVDYARPERMFGVTTNNFFKNVGWAKKGILSFSHTPLNLLTAFSIGLFMVMGVVVIAQIGIKFFYPVIAPKGITTLMLIQLFFGSTILLAISLVGEYIAKIFDEVKRRPHFIRRHIIRHGEIKQAVNYLGHHRGDS